MHPLDKDHSSLDQSWHEEKHETAPKRRRSLDNSCLVPQEVLRELLQVTKDFNHSPKRRLSYNQKACMTTTFLASADRQRLKVDLDADFHHYEHVSTTSPGQRSPSSKLPGSEGSNETFDTLPMEADDASVDASSLCDCESDMDSFCDASVQEEANKEYLVKDLGASCFWGSNNDLGLDTADFGVELEAMQEEASETCGNEDEQQPVIGETLPDGHVPEQPLPVSPQRKSSKNPIRNIVNRVRKSPRPQNA